MKLLEKVNRRLLGKGYPGREAVAENFRILNTEKQADGKLEEFYREKLKLLALVLLGGVLLTVALAVSESRSSLLEDGYFLPRREKSYTQELWVIPDKESGKAKEELTLEIEPRGMTAEQVKTLLAEETGKMEGVYSGKKPFSGRSTDGSEPDPGDRGDVCHRGVGAGFLRGPESGWEYSEGQGDGGRNHCRTPGTSAM